MNYDNKEKISNSTTIQKKNNNFVRLSKFP